MDTALNTLRQDIETLLRREADPRTGQLTVTPEVAEWLGKGTPRPAERSVATPVPQQAERELFVEPAPTAQRVAAAAGSETLDALAEAVAGCQRCSLCKTRTQTVFGSGNQNADLVFVGEAPGEEEDRQGIPFVGRAGQLLTTIIEHPRSMGLPRDSVYICNVLKCRPPGNRNPAAEEMTQCEPYLVRQLELLQPKVICALGGYAAKQLLKTDAPVGRLRGKWHSYHGIPVRVTYHPSYLLRLTGDAERAEKRKVLDDVLAVMRVLKGEETPE